MELIKGSLAIQGRSDAMDQAREKSMFNVELNGSLDWSFIRQSRFNKIYNSACNQAWSPRLDLKWEAQSKHPENPYNNYSLPLTGFPEFEALPIEKKHELCWQCHSIEISELLHGEQIAMIVAAQLVNEAPTFATKMAACAQVSDEARHLDFFTQYMSKFSLTITPPSAALHRFANIILNDKRPDYKCLACQVLLESMALAKFEEVKQDTSINVLKDALRLILREEARHIGSGSHWLKPLHQSLDIRELKQRLRYVLDMLLTLSESDYLLTQIASQEGWCERQLKQHIRVKQHSKPERVLSRRKHLASALTRSGLLTRETRKMIAGILGDENFESYAPSIINP